MRRFEAGKEMPHTRKTFTMAMRPQEIAEVMVDDVRSESDVKAVKLLETKPAQISGQTGFRAVIAFRDSDGMKFKAVLAGVLVGSDLWRLVYVAPERHYFELDLATFDAALASFRVKS